MITATTPSPAGSSPAARGRDIRDLTERLCRFATGVVAPDNAGLFELIRRELPVRILRYRSGESFNGWVVPPEWQVERALIRRDGQVVFDGTCHPLAVASQSRSFQGALDREQLEPHLITNPDLPQAHVYHCCWQYRPWDADWAFCVPHVQYRRFGPGRYEIDLLTRHEAGDMMVADLEWPGRSRRTIVFSAHTCHAVQANDDFAGVAVLVRLFQWLRKQDTYYTYRLVLGPEHLGTIFYLRDLRRQELQRLVGGAFAEMPGTPGAPIKVTASFLGDQPIDLAFRNAARTRGHVFVPWREGAGNDETVWEAPGYEVPFVEVSRCRDTFKPFPEYHSSLDTPDRLDPAQLQAFYETFAAVVRILERNAVAHRRFNGLICLSNPEYGLYFERPDPAVAKALPADSEKWGHLLDSLLRYFDGSTTVLDIAEKHGLPFDPLHEYLQRFEERGLIRTEFVPIRRRPISTSLGAPADGEGDS